MFWSLCCLSLRWLVQLVLLRRRSQGFKELEIVVLRRKLAVLRRQTYLSELGQPDIRQARGLANAVTPRLLAL